MQRQFTSGSRQAPDPFDQFLEEHQFYRKHTARDASCLFRVISEQMYDTQLHHLAIREKCVTYMRKHRKFFDYLVDQDFDEYLDDMSKPKTYGTLVELQAAGYMFERNVFLFEPFNLGTYFNDYRVYFKEVFRVFYTPERHFDSVFTSDYIQEAAICQSICYEILYKDLFKLPDVSFAVEQMLHGPTFENMEYRTETNEDGYSTRLYLSDGRTFELDLPQNTNCILENYKLCHFHYINFPRFSDDLQRELKLSHCEEYDKSSLLIQRTAESFLPNKYVSCVRQLLQEGITPFPYKVAKALDPNMYRNIEFDSWNEMRKELKLQNWYSGDANFKVIRYTTRRVRKIFQVGAKCHVKLRKSEQDLYTCHIQEIAVDKGQCIVFVEQLGEKRLVPYENLTPLPPDQFKPWAVPYRFQRHMQKYSSVRYTRQYNYRFKFNATTEHHLHHHHGFDCGSGMVDNDSCSNECIDDDPKKQQRSHYNHHQQHCSAAAAASYYKLKQYTHLENFRMRTDVEYCTMPLTVEHSTGRDVDSNKCGSQQRAGDSSENSRTPSRSSTAMTVHHNSMIDSQVKSTTTSVCNAGDHHLATPIPITVPHMEVYDVDHYNPNGAIYMQDLQGFYPMYPYTTASGMPDDYYGYCGYDVGMPPGTAFMPAVNSGNAIYYLCNNAIAPPGNYISSGNPYMPPPPPPTIGLPQPSPMLTSANTPNSAAISNFPYAQIGSGTATTSQPTSLAPPSNNPVNNTPSRLANRGNQSMSTTTPLSGRINYEAKKSMKANGADLPPDVATLRYFYNLGLDYYRKQKPNDAEKPVTELNDEAEQVTHEFQNIKLDENANQISNTKSDANNNNNNLHATQSIDGSNSNDNNNPSNKHENAVVNSSTTANKNNARRYSSRYFRGKDSQMPQRYNNNTNHHNNTSTNGQHHQSYHNQAAQRNLGAFNNNKYATHIHNSSTTPNSSRNTSQSYGHSLYLHNHHHQSQQQQQQQHLSHPSMIEQSIQTSPMCGFDDTVNRANSTDSHNCQTPTVNNQNPNQVTTYGSYMEQTNDGINSGASMVVPMPNANGGVYIQMPMTSGPPPPYGLFPPNPSHQVAAGMGMHPNYMTGGPPPQFNPHGIPPLALNVHGATNSTTGSDCAENEMSGNNGLLGMGNGGGLHLPCPNFPPPMPYYYSASGGGVGLPASANGGVHFVPPLPHHQVAPPTSSNQTAFTAPHPSMGSQGYFCLPPPSAPTHQMPPQQMPLPQQSPMSNNRSPLSGAVAAPIPQDVNNITRSDIPVPNND